MNHLSILKYLIWASTLAIVLASGLLSVSGCVMISPKSSRPVAESLEIRSPSAAVSCRNIFHLSEADPPVTFSHTSPIYTLNNLKEFKQINDQVWKELLPNLNRNYHQEFIWKLVEGPLLMKDAVPLFSSPERALERIHEGIQQGIYGSSENLKNIFLLESSRRYLNEVKDRSGYSPEKVWRAQQSAWKKYFGELPRSSEGALFELYLKTLKRESEATAMKELDLSGAFIAFGVDAPTRIRLLEKAAAAHLIVRTKGATTFRNTVELTEEGRVLLQYYLKDVADQLR